MILECLMFKCQLIKECDSIKLYEFNIVFVVLKFFTYEIYSMVAVY